MQDCSVLHAPPGIPTDVGPGATIAHSCVIHGVHVGAEAVIANHATVLAGTGAEMWVNTNPAAYQDLARRYQAGLELITEM